MRFILIFLLFFFSGFSLVAQGAAINCSTSVSKAVPEQDSSVEIEMGLNEKIVDYITTETGTLTGLFLRDRHLPEELVSWIKKEKFKDAPLTYSFEELPRALKLLALKKGIVSQRLEFGDSVDGGRRIHGILIKKQFQEKYDLLPTVELGNMASSRDANMIELHMRAKKWPGHLAKQAAQFQKALGYLPGPMHMHVVFPLPKKWLGDDPLEHSWKLYDYWRRLNLAMEMRDVFENGRSLINNYAEFEGSFYTNFGPLSKNGHAYVLSYLMAVGLLEGQKGRQVADRLKTRAKIAWVGFFSHHKYDQPNLFGFELRFLDGSDLPLQLLQFLNELPNRVNDRQFGIEDQVFKLWGQKIKKLENEEVDPDLAESLGSDSEPFPLHNEGSVNQALNPHHRLAEIFKNLPFSFQKILLGINTQEVQKSFNSRGRLMYLLHDWSLDPLYFDKPQEQIKIRNQQLRALRRWARGENETQVLQDFLLESGLYSTFS
ncbi:MAG: hypothetical protein ACK5V3_02955, partial [Bdellovibrionales bacterium]